MKKTIAFTGKLSQRISKLKKMAQNAGFTTMGHVGEKTDYLVVGEDPAASKLQQAKLNKRTSIISEAEFLQMADRPEKRQYLFVGGFHDGKKFMLRGHEMVREMPTLNPGERENYTSRVVNVGEVGVVFYAQQDMDDGEVMLAFLDSYRGDAEKLAASQLEDPHRHQFNVNGQGAEMFRGEA